MPSLRPSPSRCGALLLAASSLLLSGCVFDDIHEELVTINANMKTTQDILHHANATLDEVHHQLDEVQKTNELLVELQAGLGTEAAAGVAAKNRASIIGTMESIDASLAKMDVHLSALRKTIANIDSTIPFLSFSAEAPEDDATEVGEVEVEEGVFEPEASAERATEPQAD